MVLVSTIGDFHSSVLPIFYQYKDEIKKHIVIYDDFKCDVKEAKRLIRGIKNFSKKNNLNIKTFVHCIDEDSYSAINETIKFIDKNVKNKTKLLINSTDGLSNVNILLAQAFLPLGAKIASYDRFDNECNYITKNSMYTEKIDKVISIKDHFLLKDIEIDSIASKKFAKKYKNQILNIFEKHSKEFKSFTKYIQSIENPSLANSEFHNINQIIKQMDITDLKMNQALITGGLFEFYIYLKLKDFNFDDIEIGVQVKQYTDKAYFIPNEFDILIMKENHLHMIECKYTNKIKLDQLVYKYMALKNIIDDDGKIVMVTAHEPFNPISTNDNNPLKYLPHKRAMENKMLLLGNPIKNIDEFARTVKQFLNI